MNNYQDNNKNNENDKKPQNRQTIFIFLILALLTLIAMTIFSSFYEKASSKEITYDEFWEMLEDNKVKSVQNFIKPDYNRA